MTWWNHGFPGTAVSPYLNQFTQPDSLIPNPANPQNFNRFSYVYNRPINFNDPSGHDAYWCETAACQAGYYKSKTQGSNFLAKYGIATINTTFAQNITIYKAVVLSGQKFNDYLGSNIGGKQDVYRYSEADAFISTHGEITITFDPNANIRGSCETVLNSITCDTSPSVTGVLHEFGHVFDNHDRYNSPGDADLFAGNYFDSTELPRNFNGYQCRTSPCLEHSWQDFPIDPDFENPTLNFLEEFGDMYLNWVLDGNPDYPQNGFTTDLAGEARRQDMNNFMRTIWLPSMGLP
jgi:hypothetical protein